MTLNKFSNFALINKKNNDRFLHLGTTVLPGEMRKGGKWPVGRGVSSNEALPETLKSQKDGK